MKIITKTERKIVLSLYLIAFVLVLSYPSLAQDSQCLLDVSTSTSSSRATTGTSVTITVTTTGDSCTVNTLSIVSAPSLTVNDPASGQYSGFTAGTAKTFTVTAGTADTYTYYARGTTSAGSVDSTSQILEFISPADLTVTTSQSASQVVFNGNFTLTVNIDNPQASDVSTSYTITLPSELTRLSGDPLSSSGTTIGSSSTKTLSILIKHSTCFTGSKSITFDLGDTTGAASASVSGNSSCGTSGTGNTSGTSAATGGGAVASPTEVLLFTAIQPGTTVTKKLTLTSIAFTEIELSVLSQVSTARLSVKKLSSKPGSVTTPVGTVFQYLELNATGVQDSNINTARIRFRVDKSWLTSNGFDSGDAVLQRFSNGVWERLTTSLTSENATFANYEAVTPGFSVFAITAEQPVAPPVAQQNQQQQTEQNATNTTDTTPTPPPPDGGSGWIYIVIAIVIAGVAGFLFYKKPKMSFIRKPSFKPPAKP